MSHRLSPKHTTRFPRGLQPLVPCVAQFSCASVAATAKVLLPLRQAVVQFVRTVLKLSVAEALMRCWDFAKGSLLGLPLRSAFAGRLICFLIPPSRSAVSRVLSELVWPCFLPPRFWLLRPPHLLRGS